MSVVWLLVGWVTIVISAPPKAILSIFIDDLGAYDTSVQNPAAPTPNLKRLSHEEGLRLDRHYVFKYCSPTRRSFLSGRYPVHITDIQAPICSNVLPLEFTLLSQKLKEEGSVRSPFNTHFVGKGHLGYQTMDHLPINRGFDSHVGYLAGAETYEYGNNTVPTHDCPGKPAHCLKDFWHGTHPATELVDQIYYSTNWYTEQAQKILREHAAKNTTQPLWMYLPYQAVHAPYTDTPSWERIPSSSTFWDHTFGDMLAVMDAGVGNVTNTLKEVGMWDDTLVIINSDNGGIGPGNNYPLRGEKATPWEGGTRVTAFLTGGYLPANLRGQINDQFIHVADWYPTLCKLAGGTNCTDTVMMDGAERPIDGIDVWPMITNPKATNPREWLPITYSSIIWKNQYKLITSAAPTFWYDKNDTHFPDNRTAWPCRNKQPPTPPPSCTPESGYACHDSSYCGPSHSFYYEGNEGLTACAALCTTNATCHCFDAKGGGGDGTCSGSGCSCRLHTSAKGVEKSSAGYSAYVRQTPVKGDDSDAKCEVCTPEHPCLFDILADPEERTDISTQHPTTVKTMQQKLATYKPYVTNKMDLSNYNCVTDIRPWWGEYSGPCCKPKV